MFDLYTWPTPNGRKVSIALEEFEVAYTATAIDITQGEQFGEAFLALSPNNKIPAVFDHDTQTGLMESGAILIYLADKYDRFWGDERYLTLQWLMFQMCGLGPNLGQAHHFLKYNQGKAPYAETRFHEEAKRLYGVLNRRLAEAEFLAGAYSIADMASWPWVSRYEWQQIDLAEFPSVLAWYRRIAERGAVQRGYAVPFEVNPIPIP